MSALVVLLVVVAGLWLVSWFLDSKEGPGIDGFVPGVILMQALGGIRQYALSFFLVALALHLPHWMTLLTTAVPSADRQPDELWTSLGSISLLIPFALQGALGFGCSAPLRGRRPTFGEIVGAAPGGLWRTLPTVILVVVGVVAAPVVLVLVTWSGNPVPWSSLVVMALVVLVVHARLALAVPAAWRERLGPIRAIRRSFVLTRGHRGRLGLMVLALWIGGGLTLGILVGLGRPFVSGSFGVLWAIAGIAVVGSLFGLLYTVATWIIYERVRRIEIGNPLEPPVAAVFE